MLDLKNLESFTIAPAGLCTSISHLILQMSLSELKQTCNAIRNLTAIALEISRHNQCSETNWEMSRDSCSLARILSGARNLTPSELAFDDDLIIIPQLDVLVDDGIWRNLRSSKLYGMVMEKDEFANFLNRHRNSSRDLELDFMLLLKEGYKCDDDTRKSWLGVYQIQAICLC